MNLIEQLDGYEKAKNIHAASSDGSTAAYVNGCFYSKESLGLVLLEHRRANNIFEVGDLVVEVTEYPESSILQVKHVSDNLMVCENDSLNASYGLLNNTPSFYVRHATPKEIEAGHRL